MTSLFPNAPEAFTTSYVPEFTVTINDVEMPRSVRHAVTSVAYADGVRGSDRVDVVLANPDLVWFREHIRGLGFQPVPTRARLSTPLIDLSTPSGLFDIGNKLTLDIGYVDRLERVFEGDVTGLEASFSGGGMPTFTLVAQDYLQRLAGGSAASGNGLIPDSVVAAILIARHRLLPVIDPAIVAASTALAGFEILMQGRTGESQKGQSDLEMLAELAARYDADYWVDGDTLYLSRFLKSLTPELTHVWGQSMIDFHPTVNTVGQIAGVSMRIALQDLPLEFVVTVYWDFDAATLGLSVLPGLSLVGAGDVGELTAGGSSPPEARGKGPSPTLTILDQPIRSPSDMAKSALLLARELRKRLNRRLTATATFVGDPKLRAGKLVQIEGVGQDFSGPYRIESATHELGESGYRTTCQMFREIMP